MTLTELGDRLIGGVLPYVPKPERDVHPVDGTTYTVELVWWRRTFTAGYHTPRHPRSVRRARAAERARDAELIRRHTAGEPTTQVGDVLNHRYIPVQVVRCRDAQYDEWRRAVGDECYPRDDITGELDRSQAYEWVQENRRPGHPLMISGHATEEGVLTHLPVVVLEISEDVPASRTAS